MTANYELRKQNSYCIRWEELARALRISNRNTKQQSVYFQYYFAPVCSLNEFRQTLNSLNSRVFSWCIGLALSSQNLTGVTLPLLTSLRRTVGVSPDYVRLIESSLQIQSRDYLKVLIQDHWFHILAIDRLYVRCSRSIQSTEMPILY